MSHTFREKSDQWAVLRELRHWTYLYKDFKSTTLNMLRGKGNQGNKGNTVSTNREYQQKQNL